MRHHQGEGSVGVTIKYPDKYRDTHPNIRLSDRHFLSRMATLPSRFIDPLLRLYSPTIHKDNVHLSIFTKDPALARTGRGTNRHPLQVMALTTQTFQSRLLDLLHSTLISDQCHLNRTKGIGHNNSWNNRK
jgi:hypothetical protein